VLAVLALLLYHASRPFDTEVWHLKNLEKSAGLELFGNLLTPWRLPLLFMISGLGTYYALGFRSAWRYARERLGACSSRSRSGWRWSSCHRSTWSASAWACPTG
jgi:hypothetical protein